MWIYPIAGYMGVGSGYTLTVERRPLHSRIVDAHGLPIEGAFGRLVIPMPQQTSSGEWIAAGTIAVLSDSLGRLSWGQIPTGIWVVVEIADANRYQRIHVPSGTSEHEI